MMPDQRLGSGSDPLNNSYYVATANVWETQPALTGEAQCDICVIGGGFTGLSAALACAEKGMSVMLLEAQTIGFGASGRNGGQLIPGLRWSMREIDAGFGRARAQAIFDLAWGASNRVQNRITKHDIKCDVVTGHLEAAYKPKHFNDMQAEAEFLSKEFGWDSVRVVQPADMDQHIRGGDYHGGVYDHKGGHFHPLNYTLGLARAAIGAGVRIHEHSPVSAYSDTGPNGVQIVTKGADVNAKHIIVATDAWIGNIAPDLGRYTIPIMNYNIATAPLPDADALLPSNAAVADSRFVLNYFRLSADKRMIFGGGEKYMQTPPADIGAFVRKHMAEVFPSIAHVPIEYAWGGKVAVTSNRLPHMGRNGNVFHAHGFSGHGAMITTLAGELMAEAVAGTMERFDVFASLPHTRFPGGKLFAQPLAALGLMWFALRDKL
jgi:gamma-glutamylputrescine oxidase